MMESLGELTDYELGFTTGVLLNQSVRLAFRALFMAYLKKTGVKSHDAMSPFWRGWMTGFSRQQCRRVDIDFIRSIKRAGVTGFR